jgi:hypothetical protein
MAQTTVEIQHPTLEDVRQTVPKSQVEDWTEQGWKRVKEADRSDTEPAS